MAGHEHKLCYLGNFTEPELPDAGRPLYWCLECGTLYSKYAMMTVIMTPELVKDKLRDVKPTIKYIGKVPDSAYTRDPKRVLGKTWLEVQKASVEPQFLKKLLKGK